MTDASCHDVSRCPISPRGSQRVTVTMVHGTMIKTRSPAGRGRHTTSPHTAHRISARHLERLRHGERLRSGAEEEAEMLRCAQTEKVSM